MQERIKMMIKDILGTKVSDMTIVELENLMRRVVREELNHRFRERDYFTDRNISILFDVSRNTPANWRKGEASAPEGFFAALKLRNYKALCKCAERYRANRAKCDVMNTKKVIHYREGYGL